MFEKIFYAILLTNLGFIAATDRTVVYEKCRGPGEILMIEKFVEF